MLYEEIINLLYSKELENKFKTIETIQERVNFPLRLILTDKYDKIIIIDGELEIIRKLKKFGRKSKLEKLNAKLKK